MKNNEVFLSNNIEDFNKNFPNNIDDFNKNSTSPVANNRLT